MKTREQARAYLQRRHAARLARILEAILLRVILLELLVLLFVVTR